MWNLTRGSVTRTLESGKSRGCPFVFLTVKLKSEKPRKRIKKKSKVGIELIKNHSRAAKRFVA